MIEDADPFARIYTDKYEVGDAVAEARHIVCMMSEGGPRYGALELAQYEDLLSRAIGAMQRRFLDEDDDMRRRAAKEGTPGKPFRRLSRNWLHGDDAPEFDYSEWQTGDQDAEWRGWWDQEYAKKISPETGERARNPGWFRERGAGGEPVMKAPLVRIYFLCNRFFRRVLGREFYPIFAANDHATTDSEAFPHLNEAARFFLLMAQAADSAYTREHCKRVHDDCYHQLGIEGRKISHHSE